MDDKTFVDGHGHKRLRDTEFVFPIVTGTAAWWMGKKASDASTHRWTVFVRGPNHEDLSHVVEKVTFELHHTFINPHRTVEVQPYEVTESGWGEFDINIVIHFRSDAHEAPVTLTHHLKLYESENAPQSTKKPVMNEVYEELVFVEPVESFYNRVAVIRPGPYNGPELSQKPWCLPIDDSEERARLRECRARVAAAAAQTKQGGPVGGDAGMMGMAMAVPMQQ